MIPSKTWVVYITDDPQCKKTQTSGVCGLYMFIGVREQQFICGQPSSSAAAAPASPLASSCLAHDHPAETTTRNLKLSSACTLTLERCYIHKNINNILAGWNIYKNDYTSINWQIWGYRNTITSTLGKTVMGMQIVWIFQNWIGFDYNSNIRNSSLGSIFSPCLLVRTAAYTRSILKKNIASM